MSVIVTVQCDGADCDAEAWELSDTLTDQDMTVGEVAKDLRADESAQGWTQEQNHLGNADYCRSCSAKRSQR